MTMLDITVITQCAHGLHFGWPWEVTVIGLWGYTPVRITGVLVIIIIIIISRYRPPQNLRCSHLCLLVLFQPWSLSVTHRHSWFVTRSSASAETACDVDVGAHNLSPVYNLRPLNSPTDYLSISKNASCSLHSSIPHLFSRCNWKQTAGSRWTCFGV